MHKAKFFIIAALLVTLILHGCGKHDEPKPVTQANSQYQSATNPANRQEEYYDSIEVLKAALLIAQNLTEIPDPKEKFPGYENQEAIARHTNVQKNFHWQNFAEGTIQDQRSAYHTPKGDFLVLSAVANDKNLLGLVINLDNQKTAFYPIGASKIEPAGDNFASALIVALEVENKVKASLGNANYTNAELKLKTIATIEHALVDSGNRNATSASELETKAKANDIANGNAYAEAIATQQINMSKQVSERKLKEIELSRVNAMNERVLHLFYAAFESAKTSGLRLNDPRPHIQSVNMGRRNSGVWELVIEPYRSDSRFVLVRDLGVVYGMFSVEGAGPISADTYIRDAAFEETGLFSRNCKYEIVIGIQSEKYGCMAFFVGKHDKEAFNVITTMVAAEVKRVSGGRNQRNDAN